MLISDLNKTTLSSFLSAKFYSVIELLIPRLTVQINIGNPNYIVSRYSNLQANQ